MSPSPASSPSTTMARGSRFTTSVVSNQPPGAYSHPSQGPTPPFAPGSAGLDAAIVNERLDTILQQNQQQRALLNELISLMKGSGMNVPDSIVQSAVLPSSGPPVTSAFSTVTPQALEAQVSSMIRENEERKRENELLRREYDTLRRETELLLQVQAQLRQQNEALRREQADRVQSQATIPATEGDGADAGVSSGEGGEA
ncbi:hypothetical protein DFJ73DRAFT_828361 [Zopfochytrium polystomum]|nr:hypothetical protein DFJ73DRAFT_828361 [Zopfochytrium polystomum]